MNHEKAAERTAAGGSIESQLTETQRQLSTLASKIDQQERLFDGIFSSISDFAYAFDSEGRFIFINKALLDLWGMELEDAVGKTFHELPYPEDLATRLQQQILHVYTTGENVVDETPYTNPEGKLGYYEYIFCPVRTSAGTIEFVAGSTRDITKRKQVEHRLAESEEQYRTLFNSIDEGFCIIEMLFDPQGMPNDYRFLEINPSFVKQTGLSDVVGKTVREIVPEHEKHWYEIYGAIALTGEPSRFEHKAEALNHWYDVFAFRIGEPADRRVAIIFNDIGERKKAEAEIRELSQRNREILESITDSFIAVDRDWRFTYVNRQAERLLHRRPGDLLGQVMWDEFPGLAGTEFERVYRQAARDGISEQFTAYYPDHGVWYDVTCYPAQNGITVYFRDVTERVRAEEALRDSDRRKDEFLATLAHELRNPLAPIRSGLELLRGRKGADESSATTLDMIERQTNQIVRLVDDLLDLSRITQGKIRLRKERFELRRAIEMAIETSKNEIDNSGNELIVTLPYKPLYLEADLTRTAQIFLNILNNAAKFSPAGGKILLAVERADGEAVISIKDEGRGIAAASLPKIFEIFGQVDSPERRDQGGLGIGLSVVRQLAEMHGGKVEAFSEGLGKGSKFVVRLPLADSAEPATEPKSETVTANGKASRRKILVVDDNHDAADMMEMLLTIQGHDVRKTFDGASAVEIAREFLPEVCCLDIGLPGMSGLELATELRKFLPNSLLVSISGWGQEQDRQRSRESGFDHHLVKPVEFNELIKLIDSASPQS